MGQAPLVEPAAAHAHLDDILAIDRVLDADEDREVHLYITDYRSLYVAHVGEITKDDVRLANDGAVPAFYTPGMVCDCWFRLLDIRRFIADDTVGVVEELKKLANTRYDDRPVSIYGGMVDLPPHRYAKRIASATSMTTAIAEEQTLNTALKSRLQNGAWFASQLPPILKDLSATRNAAAHSSRIPAAEVLAIQTASWASVARAPSWSSAR